MRNDEVIKLQEQRARLVAEMRTIQDKAESDGRDFTAEESQEWDRLDGEVDALRSRITRSQKLAEEERALEQPTSSIDPRLTRGDARDAEELNADYSRAFEAYCRRGFVELSDQERKVLRLGFGGGPTASDDGWEQRDQAKGTNASGGFLVPTSFQKELYTHLVQAGTMRLTRVRTLTTTSGETLQWPKTTAHGAATWQSEGATFSSSDESFGQVSLTPQKAVRLVKVSLELLEDNAVDLEAYLGLEIGRSIGALENTAYVNGTGTGQPQGIVGKASSGKVGATGQTTSVGADDLIDLFYAVPPQYRRSAEWMMADGTVKAVRKLKDAAGNYLWASGIGGYGVGAVLANPAPDTLLGRPVWDDPDVPAMAANAKSVLFGDFSAYIIRDVGVAGPIAGEKGISAFYVRRLDERFADSGQVGFLGWHRTDGNLIDLTGAVAYYQNSAT
jgi:HK97 family phage major capsid protein